MRRVTTLTLVLLLYCPSSGAQPSEDPNIAKLVAQLGDRRKARSAHKALKALGYSALEPMRKQISTLPDDGHRALAKKVWSKLVTHHARGLLRRGRAATPKVKWSLAVKSELFPYLRCYRARAGKYPQAVILDIEQGDEPTKVTSVGYQKRIRRRGIKCRSRKVATELVRFFVALRNQPYGDDKIKLKVRRRGKTHRIEATHSRALPWDDGRTRTEVRVSTFSLSRKCRFRLMKERTVSVVYSSK